MRTRHAISRLALAAGLAALVPALAYAQSAALPPAPEAPGGVEERAVARAQEQMVVAANPIAAEAGLAVLRAGGSAVDAMVTTQLVLNIVEP